MAWRDEGVLLSARRHGEADAIIEALTAAHGRHAGVVKGGGGRRMAQLQPGTQIALEWRARLADHLGTVRVEPLRD
ncbi:MAG: DNA repair protein RecO, partial [Rhodobacterales bacterium CG_4_9_14_3_um_filter_71_31]